jgi:hypothetical protein
MAGPIPGVAPSAFSRRLGDKSASVRSSLLTLFNLFLTFLVELGKGQTARMNSQGIRAVSFLGADQIVTPPFLLVRRCT